MREMNRKQVRPTIGQDARRYLCMNSQPAFCPSCGGSLVHEQRDGRPRPVCPSCGFIVYLNPVPSVAAILSREGRVLLVKRNIDPGRGYWCLPGGFIEAGESPQDAVVREVEEETGFRCRPLGLVDVQAVLGGYYGDIIVICYAAQVLDGTLKAGEDAAEADFFDLDALPGFAFSVHRRFLEKHIGRNLATRNA
jgi:8-oxo-dGTP diphosphatase